LASNYITEDEIKEAMPDQSWSTAYDSLLDSLASRASRAIDRYTNRAPGSYLVATTSIRYFTGDGSIYLYPGEMAEAPTAVAVAETGDLTTYTAWSTASDYWPTPYNAASEGEPYTGLEIDPVGGTKMLWPTFPRSVRVTAKWGHAASVPDDVKQAALIQAVRWFKRGQQGYQDVGAIAELGQLRYVKGLDPDVETLIEHLRRQAV
jgi:hypothetical protein